MRWGAILERPVNRNAAGEPQIALDLGALRFVRDRDGRGEGLGGIDLVAADRARIVDAAERRGYRAAGDSVTVCGTRFRLIAAEPVSAARIRARP